MPSAPSNPSRPGDTEAPDGAPPPRLVKLRNPQGSEEAMARAERSAKAVFKAMQEDSARQAAAAAAREASSAPQVPAGGATAAAVPPRADDDGRKFLYPDERQVAEDAALAFVRGNEEAPKSIQNFIRSTRRRGSLRMWYLMLDMFQASGNRVSYDKMSDIFSRNFLSSPPPYEEWPADESVHKGSVVNHNVLVVDGFASRLSPSQIDEFLAHVVEAGEAKLDVSRLRVEPPAQSEQQGRSIGVIESIVARLTRAGRPVILMGRENVIDVLEVIRRRGRVEDEAAWLALFGLLQWTGAEDDFQVLEMEYLGLFGKSPPGYEMDKIIAREPLGDDARPKGGQVPQRITEQNVSEITDMLAFNLGSGKNSEVDFSHVRTISFEAATRLAYFLSQDGGTPEQIKFIRPTQVVMVLLEMAGASEMVTVIPRRR